MVFINQWQVRAPVYLVLQDTIVKKVPKLCHHVLQELIVLKIVPFLQNVLQELKIYW
jgi:hypothetical protein